MSLREMGETEAADELMPSRDGDHNGYADACIATRV